MYEFRSKCRPLALLAWRACLIKVWPTSAAKKPTQKPTTAKSGKTSPKTKKDVEEEKLVNKIMADEVALATAGWTPMASMIGTVIT
jgi:hypothetical protein